MGCTHSSYPSGHQTFFSNQQNAYIEFPIVADTCLINFTRWNTGGYIDVLVRETNAFGSYHWVNRIDTWNGVGNSFTHGTPTNPGHFHHSGALISVLATNVQNGYGRIRVINRKGRIFV